MNETDEIVGDCRRLIFHDFGCNGVPKCDKGDDVFDVHGMEWNGMEWNGMEWNGMEWNDIILIVMISFYIWCIFIISLLYIYLVDMSESVVPCKLFEYDETFMNMVDAVFPESKSESVNNHIYLCFFKSDNKYFFDDPRDSVVKLFTSAETKEKMRLKTDERSITIN